MAKSRYEYVKAFEQDDRLLPGCWIVVRIDGKGFTKFAEKHKFEKPNDFRALSLMNEAAKEVLQEFSDIRIAFGESDEYSFVFSKDTNLYGRRCSKLLSLLVSCFTAAYVRYWPAHMTDMQLQSTPVFDGRCVCYPGVKQLRDYLCWRQVDTHVNNQYNTCFWSLMASGRSPTEAQRMLQGTLSDFKNDLLFKEFGINYNDLPDQAKKGSVLIRQPTRCVVKYKEDGTPVQRVKQTAVVLHVDIIKEAFWEEHPEILA